MAQSKSKSKYFMQEAAGYDRMAFEHITPQQYVQHYKQYLPRYIARMNPSKDTLATYYSAIDQFIEWCKANDITPLDLGDYQGRVFVEWLTRQHYSLASIANKVIAVRNFFSAALRLGFLEINPFEDISVNTSASEGSISFFTTEEIYQIVQVFEQEKDDFTSARNLAMLYLMGIEGLRNVEVHRMNREDIDWSKETIHIHGKGHERMIYPCRETIDRIRSYLAVCIKPKDSLPTPLFLTNSRAWYGQRISRNGIRHVMNTAEKMVGLKKSGNSCHIFRHSVGTNLYAATKDLRLVQETLGHRDPKMTAKYAHMNERMEQRLTGILVPSELINTP